jgi:alkanesulfonate monooxygenase SsuD/methylene tetrahydromethanopterin reductase-like flavin-dependent oxidoreductase (luciferase family)
MDTEGYDVIGDVQGCADKLGALLDELGYLRADSSELHRHPMRHAIFVGDLIDRGPQQAAALEMVEEMVEAGAASVVMGIHEFNAQVWSPDRARAMYDVVDQACVAAGRDPASLRRSGFVFVCCGADEREVARRAAALGSDELRARATCSTPDEVADQPRQWGEASANTVYLCILDLADLDHVRLLGREVRPHLE